MRSFGKRVRNVLAATLSAALIASGVALAAPAAYAEEGAPAEAAQTVEASAPAETSEAEVDVSGISELESSELESSESESGALESSESEPAESESPEQPAPETAAPAALAAPADGTDQGSVENGSTDDSAQSDSLAPSKLSSRSFTRASMSKLAPEPAEGAQLSVSKTTGLNPEGEEITVTGAGYTIDPAGVYAQIGWIKEGVWTPLAPDNTRSENRAGVETAWVGNTMRGASEPWVTAEDGTGSFSWTVTVDQASLEAEKLDGGTLAVFTLGAHGNFVQPDNERFVPISFAEGAQLSVSKTTGLNPEGEEITVTGAGYEINRNGIYAQIGWIVEGDWTPISDTETNSGNRGNAYSAWVGMGFPGQPEWTIADDGTGSFSWTVTIDQETLAEVKLEGGTLAVFTLGAHGNWVQPDNERFVPISFAEGPRFSLSKTELDPAGDSLTVSGAGFDISAEGLPPYYGCGEGSATAKKGFYVQVGWITDNWRPSADGKNKVDRLGGPNTWFADESNCLAPSAWTVADDGTANFEYTFDFSREDLGELPEGARYAVFTSGAGGGTQAVNEVAQVITFIDEGSANPDTPETPDASETPDAEEPAKPSAPKPATHARAAGTLIWGVSSGFADYVTGNIAKGKISTSGVGKSGGNYLFPQATGSDWDFKTQTGTVRYSGVVTFQGHEMGGQYLMSETFANPVIRVTSATSGTITVHGQSYALNLASGSKSTSDGGAVTWRNVPVNGGISGGSGGAGGSFAYNSLSFTVGATSRANFGSTAVSHPAQTREAAATPPATTGIRVMTPEDELVAGGEVEFEADGFEANERDVLVVMYSDPIVLDRNAGADENGTVRWTGTLPEDLHGEHTLTLQGSTVAGAVINIMTQEEYDEAHAEVLTVASDEAGEAVTQTAGPVATSEDAPIWVIWVGALGLLVVAAGMAGLVIAQRRRSVA